MNQIGNSDSWSRADAVLVGTVPQIRRAVRRVLEEHPTPNDKDQRDPWARPLGYDADKAVCRCCLRAFDEITDRHLAQAHGIRASEYADQYDDPVRDPEPLGEDELTTAEWKGWAHSIGGGPK
ncbi:hypothetical protein GRX01_07815 [Halobaculum sp. WSA2]|uniref:Uncharacterized protein n=1 Tax=Halobaculum saliterrae TaxID=2073113 RepID=A0A6B0SY45_9EURY|nr:hypothetical protein [Halobaculum saliterrae]MXR41242.1 hypothetical protein [Halobaculum saliterrae]